MTSKKTYFLAGLSSYVIWGFVPIFLKQLTGYDDYEIIFYRIALAAVIMAVILVPEWRSALGQISELYKKSKKDFVVMAVLTLIGAALLATNWVTYVYVVNHVSISAASFAYLILPITTAFLAMMILGEKLNLPKWIAVIMSALSCYLIANVDLRQILYIAAIALSYSFYLISQRRNTLIPRKTSLALQMAAGTLLMLLIDPIKTSPVELNGHFWLYVFIIAAVFTVAPLLLNLFALNGMASSQLAFLIYVNPIISFITGIAFYGERLEEKAVIAYALLTLAIVIFNWEFIARVTKQRLSPAVAKTE